MKYTVLGIGAGGNKGAITLIEKGIISKEYVKLFNTTLKDVPDNYKDIAIHFASELGGSGKERHTGYKAAVAAIQNGTLDIAQHINPDSQAVIIVTSTEGGTGSGATPAFAKYCLAMNLPVHVFALLGFEDEVRGLKNTLSFFNDLDSNVILHTIRNTSFLDYTGNRSTAEKAANDKFAEDVLALTGSVMIPSAQNIDDKDMYKICCTPAYMDIEKVSLSGVKNEDLFNKAISNTYDTICSLEFDKSVKRLGVIINASEKTVDAIDQNFEVVKRYIGEPYETYTHIQYDNGEEYMYIFACGMNFPEEAIKEIAKKYEELNSKINRGTNSLQAIFSDIDLSEEDDFNMGVKQMKAPDVSKLFGTSSSVPVKKTSVSTEEVSGTIGVDDMNQY